MKENLKTSFARNSIISNNNSDDDKSNTEVISQDNPIIVQININEHFFIPAGPTSELAENRAALKL